MSNENILLILASQSPRRRMVLKKMGYQFRVIEPDQNIEKNMVRPKKISPSRYVQAAARAKSVAVAKQLKKGLIVSADTLVYYRGRTIGKPKNMSEAVKTLTGLSGQKH